ncbi:MAG: ElyC/SanA/YdcF family protein [Propionicimonas sp.]
MKYVRIARPVIVSLLGVLLAFAGLTGVDPQARAATSTSIADLKAQAIYFQRVGNTAQRDLVVSSMAASSAWEGTLWTEFLASWQSIDEYLKINSSVPTGLPDKGHVFVVLGSALTKSGRPTVRLERRLKVAITALAKYPNSMVLVTGGVPKNGKTEAQVMQKWLIAKGIKASRILVESKSASTVSNATNSMAILGASSVYTSYSLISDSSHLRRASVLFNAATVLIQEQRGAAWPIRQAANVAYPDLANAGRQPLSSASIGTIASNVASVFKLLPQYQALVARPPAAGVLTSIVVTPPTRVTYAVGESLNPQGLVVKALYNRGVYYQDVTSRATIAGFAATTVGDAEATFTYVERAVTKTSSFRYRIVKASSKLALGLSTTTIKRARTQVVVTATVTASNVVPTGEVTFSLDGKVLKAVPLAAHDAVAKVTYPKIGNAGQHQISVTYSGDSHLNAATKTVKVTVTA